MWGDDKQNRSDLFNGGGNGGGGGYKRGGATPDNHTILRRLSDLDSRGQIDPRSKGIVKDLIADGNTQQAADTLAMIDARVSTSNATTQSLQRTIGHLAESIDVGANTMEQLAAQGEQIERIHGKVDDMGRALNKGDAHLREMDNWTMIGRKATVREHKRNRGGSCRGWLERKGFLSWNKRWCAVYMAEQEMRVYKTDKPDAKVVDTIKLADVKAVTLSAEGIYLDITLASRKTLKFRALNGDEGREWQTVLKSAGQAMPGAAGGGGGGGGGGEGGDGGNPFGGGGDFGGGAFGGGGGGGQQLRTAGKGKGPGGMGQTSQDVQQNQDLDMIGNMLGDLKVSGRVSRASESGRARWRVRWA